MLLNSLHHSAIYSAKEAICIVGPTTVVVVERILLLHPHFPPQCACTVDTQTYEVQQGRVALDQAAINDGLLGVSPGFGLHLVNCSTNTLGGSELTTAQVEAEFTTKLGDMTK